MERRDGRQRHQGGAVQQRPRRRRGDPGEYLNRPGFWHGAIGVAACWLGGARKVAEPLYRCARSESADAYSLAHLGAVDAALAAGDAMLAAVAAIDADPFDRAGTAQLIARRAARRGTRGRRSHRPHRPRPGPGPAVPGRRHAQRVADLTIYIRQSHAERDLAELGRLAGASMQAVAPRNARNMVISA